MTEPVKLDNITGFEIAIIGMNGRFPGADCIEKFWQNLTSGVESISYFTEEELKTAGVTSGLSEEPNYIKAGAFLEDTDAFDASFFGYSPREAQLMVPQMRLFHECVWQALEDAGYYPLACQGDIGLYAGASSGTDWEVRTYLSGQGDKLGVFHTQVLVNRDQLCTRISYNLNLKGPSVFVQTACSTSLVSVHLACQGLLSGECDMALAGAVSISNTDRQGYLYQEGGIFSPDGHCRAFDADANGSVAGEGLGVVVLKPLENALADGDHIHAVIKGSAINNDGSRKVGYTAPSAQAQALVIRNALKAAEVPPKTISYIEAHGTGTSVGDPIEIEALKMAFNTTKKQFCQIGSVKTNVGHLIEVAGITGLIKAVLVLKHRLIPPNLHFKKQNPRIDFENSPFLVNTELLPLESRDYPLRAGVSSFGIGGTNAHVILEEAPQSVIGHSSLVIGENKKEKEYQLILLSAKTQSALDKMTENLAEYFKQHRDVNLADAAYTLKVGRTSLETRRQLVCSTIEEAAVLLANPNSREVSTYHPEGGDPPVVFMFPGLGAQYVNMGWGLYQKEPIFRREMDRCFEILETLMDQDIKEILYPGDTVSKVSGSNIDHPAWLSGTGGMSPPPTSNPGIRHLSHDINHTEITQVVIFIFEYALAKLLMAWGIMPRTMIGYSFGEYAAACISGVFSLEDGLRLVVSRGQLIGQTAPGAMLSVPLNAEVLKPMLNSQLSLAIDNGPSCIVSGSVSAVEAFEAGLKEKRHICMRLQASHALHSALMEPVLKEFKNTLEGIRFNIPQIPYLSNVTGTWMTDEDALDPQYWVNHLRQTVRFAQGVRELLKEPRTIFVEVGPGRDLNTLMARYLEKDSHQQVVDLVRHPDKKVADTNYLLRKVGRLWLYGLDIDWKKFYVHEKRQRLSLPTYPFEKQRWQNPGNFLKPDVERLARKSGLEKKPDIADWFYIPSWKRSMLPHRSNSTLSGKKCSLVFITGNGVGSRLVKQLKKEGQQVICVRIGETFARISDHLYTVNPRQPNDYDSLFHELQTRQKNIGRIIHLWSIGVETNPNITVKSFANAQDYGLYSVLYLVQAMARLKMNRNLDIVVITNNIQGVTGDEDLHPEKSTILSLVKTVPQEYPHLGCRSIDILLPVPGSPQEDRLVEHLLEELAVESPGALVAYRNNHRWVQTYEPVCLRETDTKIPRLRQKGTYLITGGLGNIGLILGKYLVKNYGARLILTGRSPLPDRAQWDQILETGHSHDPMKKKIVAVLELEKRGGEVLYFGVDAANREQMQQVILQAEERFGQLNGVIHAAGTFEPGSFQPVNTTGKNQCETHFQPKVYGLLALDELLQHKELDFCLLTSSLSPILGGLGFTAYAAANLFMDSFAHRANKTSPLSRISVNWADWQVGEETHRPLLGARVAQLNITPDEGVETFKRVLYHCKENQVVISAGDLQTRIDQWIKLDTVKGKTETHLGNKDLHPLDSRKDLTSTYLAPRNRLEKTILDIWQELFGITGIGVRDNFFELGGDSLLGITLINRLKELLGEIVHITVIFDEATVEQLTAYIDQRFPRVAARLMGKAAEKPGEYINNTTPPEIKPVNRGNTSQILEQINQFSDEELNTMLKNMLEKEEKEENL